MSAPRPFRVYADGLIPGSNLRPGIVGQCVLAAYIVRNLTGDLIDFIQRLRKEGNAARTGGKSPKLIASGLAHILPLIREPDCVNGSPFAGLQFSHCIL